MKCLRGHPHCCTVFIIIHMHGEYPSNLKTSYSINCEPYARRDLCISVGWRTRGTDRPERNLPSLRGQPWTHTFYPSPLSISLQRYTITTLWMTTVSHCKIVTQHNSAAAKQYTSTTSHYLGAAFSGATLQLQAHHSIGAHTFAHLYIHHDRHAALS